MPNRWPITSGNWSNAAIWSGSLIPTASDDVFTNNQRVNIDTDVTIRSIRNSATGSAIASAAQANCFYLNNGVTLTATAGGVIGAVANATLFPTLIISSSNSATIVGNISSSGTYANAILMTTGSSLTITGSVVTNPVSSIGPQNVTISCSSTGSLRISGSIINGGGSYFGNVIRLTAATRLDINGNLIGNVYNDSSGTMISIGGSGAVVTVTGSFLGARSSVPADNFITATVPCTIGISGSILCYFNTTGITHSSTGNITITGDILTGALNVISITGASNTIITGSVIPSTSASAIVNSSAGTITILGPISSSITFPCIQSTSTGIIFATGPFYNFNNRNAVFAQNLQLISGSTPTWTFDTETYAEQRTLYTQNYPGNFPATSNVRQGTVFGDTAQFTGTVAIPSTGSVLKGVPVDNTTGSASFDTQNVWSINTNLLTVTGSLGERLRNTSTATTDGILIASKGTL
jgi:hypothetical protein